MRPHRRQPTRLPRPWDSPGKNTGVGCHFLLQCIKMKSESEVAQSCPTLCDPMDCSLPGSSVHGIFQARVLEWGAIAFSIALTNPLPFNQDVVDTVYKMLWTPSGMSHMSAVLVHVAQGQWEAPGWGQTAAWGWALRWSLGAATRHCAEPQAWEGAWGPSMGLRL